MKIRLPLLLKSFLLCLLAGGALLNCAQALAQSSGSATITGILTDPSGRAIAWRADCGEFQKSGTRCGSSGGNTIAR